MVTVRYPIKYTQVRASGSRLLLSITLIYIVLSLFLLETWIDRPSNRATTDAKLGNFRVPSEPYLEEGPFPSEEKVLTFLTPVTLNDMKRFGVCFYYCGVAITPLLCMCMYVLCLF
jgi:hypothetical protein